MKTFEQLWEEIEDNFNFQKVHDVMTMLQWEWNYDMINGIPTMLQLKNSTKGWCRQCYDLSKRGGRRSKSMSCGGFTIKYAEYHDQPELHNELSVCFELTRWDAW